MQRRLPVENDNIPVTHVPFYLEWGGTTGVATDLEEKAGRQADRMKDPQVLSASSPLDPG